MLAGGGIGCLQLRAAKKRSMVAANGDPSYRRRHSMAQYTLQVNGRTATVESWDPAQPLLYVLRNALGLHGPKFGCGLGQCGACTVLIDGTPARSCLRSVEQAAGRAITTLEGLGTPAQPDPVQAAFMAEQA